MNQPDKRGHVFSIDVWSHGYAHILRCQLCDFMEAGDGSHRFALDEKFNRFPERVSVERLLAECPGKAKLKGPER